MSTNLGSIRELFICNLFDLLIGEKFFFTVWSYPIAQYNPILCFNIIRRGQSNGFFPIFCSSRKKESCNIRFVIFESLFCPRMIQNSNIIQSSYQSRISVQSSKIVFQSLTITSIRSMNQSNVVQNIASIKRICFQTKCFKIIFQSLCVFSFRLCLELNSHFSINVMRTFFFIKLFF